MLPPPRHCSDQGFLYDSSLSAANWTQKPYPLKGSTCAFPGICDNWGAVAGVWCALVSVELQGLHHATDNKQRA